jgi:hypothetical protein
MHAHTVYVGDEVISIDSWEVKGTASALRYSVYLLF